MAEYGQAETERVSMRMGSHIHTWCVHCGEPGVGWQ